MGLPYPIVPQLLQLAKLSADFLANCWWDECVCGSIECACCVWAQLVCAACRHAVKIAAKNMWIVDLIHVCVWLIGIWILIRMMWLCPWVCIRHEYLDYWIDCIVGMLPKSGQLIGYAWNQAGKVPPKFEQSRVLVALFARRRESVA